MAKEDISKTVVRTPFGLFKFLVMPFALRNTICDQDFIFCYIDDIIIMSNTMEEHKKHLLIVLQRLQDNRLFVNVSKCVFGRPKVNYLEYTINKDGFKPLHERVPAIVAYPEPKIFIECRCFFGNFKLLPWMHWKCCLSAITAEPISS